jgi:hypothetical protein
VTQSQRSRRDTWIVVGSRSRALLNPSRPPRSCSALGLPESAPTTSSLGCATSNQTEGRPASSLALLFKCTPARRENGCRPTRTAPDTVEEHRDRLGRHARPRALRVRSSRFVPERPSARQQPNSQRLADDGDPQANTQSRRERKHGGYRRQMVHAANTAAVTATAAAPTTSAAIVATVATSSNWSWRQIAGRRARRHRPDSGCGTGEC